MKICSCCALEKPTTEFPKEKNTARGTCQKCRNESGKKSYQKHRVKRLARMKAYRLAYPERYKATQKKKDEKFKRLYPEKLKAVQKRKRQNRRAKINEAHAKYCRNREKIDPNFRLRRHASASIRRAFRGQGLKKNSKTSVLLGVSIKEFQTAIEKLFWPGMSNKNRHKWQLDHIRPCSDFDLTDPEQQKQCFHFSNWQPLWTDDNETKKDRLDWTPHESRHSLPERLKPAPFIFP